MSTDPRPIVVERGRCKFDGKAIVTATRDGAHFGYRVLGECKATHGVGWRAIDAADPDYAKAVEEFLRLEVERP